MQKKFNHYKNLKIPAILLICLGISAVSFAQPMEKSIAQAVSPVNVKAITKDLNLPSFNVDITPTDDSSKLVVNIENPDRKKLRISIQGPSTWDVYNQTTDKAEYHTRFDFTQAEEGIYTLVIADGKKKVKKQIFINTFTEQVTHKMEIQEMP